MLELEQAGKFAEAASACEEILALFPADGDALLAYACHLRRMGRPEEAMAALWLGIGHDPGRVEFWVDAGAGLIDLGRLDEARSVTRQALRLDPMAGRGWILLGEILRRQGRDGAAEPCFRRGTVLSEQDVFTRRRLGMLLARKGCHEEAAAAFAEARHISPEDPDTLSGLGQMMVSLGWLEEGEACLRQTIAAAGDHLDARLGLSRALLLKGDFAQGWLAYEWRLKRPDLEKPNLTGPEWDGSPVLGKTVVVYAEQGFGDTLQFLRYVPLLAAICARTILIVPAELLALCKGLEGEAVTVRSRLGNLPRYDFQIPLLSLPNLLGGNDIPAPIPYLHVPEGKSASVTPPAGTRIKIGVVWAGRPTHAQDALRSVGLRTILPIAGVHGVMLYSLQMGPRAEDLHTEAHPALIEDVSTKLKDYADTAAVVAEMDLIICVDTSVAHLAGALGKPVWILIPYAPDWRWMLNREDTPWYPSMRLFRQSVPDSWDDVIAGIVEALTEMAAALPEAGCGEASEKRARALFRTGLSHQQAGRMQEAMDTYTKSANLDRRNPDLFNNLGVALQEMGRFEAAEACHRRAAALAPDNAGHLANFGSALRRLGKLAEAREVYDRARALDPDMRRLYLNAGHLFRDMGRPEEALACFERILALAPDDLEAEADRAFALLQKGDYVAGLPAYEARAGLKTLTRNPVPLPRWGGENLEGRSIFLQDEQGFGDVMQFVRFVPEVVHRGAGKVVLSCQPELMRLLARAPGVDAVVKRGGDIPACDCTLPLLSVPSVLGLSLDDLPGPVPYLRAPPPAMKLPSDGRLKLGLVWASQALPTDRTCPLPLILPSLGDPRFAVYSLQVGQHAEDLRATGADAFIHDLAPRLYDFAETAAVLKELDLVVTVDTSVAHLAGALAVPTFNLLLYASDWRWIERDGTSLWYPSITTLRQHRPNDWSGCLADLNGALAAYARGSIGGG